MKKRILLGTLVGFVVGVLITGIVIWRMAPGMMMMESHSKLGFDETVKAIQDNAAGLVTELMSEATEQTEQIFAPLEQ